MRHLVLRLEAPLVSFGDVSIDALGPISEFPSSSMITGLLANALGYRREEGERLNALQQRIVHGARIDAAGDRFTEFQTAQLGAGDTGWTTRGRAEGRAGGAKTYDSPHLRYRDHHADLRCTLALRLTDAASVAATPTLDDVAEALDAPARPLFLGRKACLPSRRILDGWVEAPSLFDALLAIPPTEGHVLQSAWRPGATVRLSLSSAEPCPAGFRAHRASERRDWAAGVHVGELLTYRGEVAVEHIASKVSEVA